MNMLHDYEGILRDLLLKGEMRGDRTGTGTISGFGYRMEHDHRLEGFPF